MKSVEFRVFLNLQVKFKLPIHPRFIPDLVLGYN